MMVHMTKVKRMLYIDLEIEDSRTFPVFGLLAQPMPKLVLLAHTTWQKFPAPITIIIRIIIFMAATIIIIM